MENAAKIDPRIEQVAEMIGKRAENLFLSRRMLCTEAVLVALNEGLGGDLTVDMAVRLASGFPMGIGDKGCTCGALTGSVLALGLFINPEQPSAADRKNARDAAAEIHDYFKSRFGSTCCRVLTKKVKNDKKAHFRQCADMTADSAATAARQILEKRPELLDRINQEGLKNRDTRMGGLLKKVFRKYSI